MTGAQTSSLQLATAIVAGYAAIVASTALTFQIFAWARGWRTRVDVRVSHGSIVQAGAVTRTDLILFRLVNHSSHPITLTLLGFAPTSRRDQSLWIPRLPDGQPLPLKIGPRDSANAWIDAAALRAHRNLTQPIRAEVSTSDGRTFRSKPTHLIKPSAAASVAENKNASTSLHSGMSSARDAAWLRARPNAIPSSGTMWAVAAWMVIAAALLAALTFLLGVLAAPQAVLILPFAGTLIYVARQGHYALWPRTPPADVSWAAAVVACLLLVVIVMLTGLLLVLLGLLRPQAVSALGFTVFAYGVTWQWRSIEATSPRIRKLRYVLCGLVLIGVGLLAAYAYGFRVKHDQVQAFYSTVAQVDAAMLLAAAFQSGWARDRRSLEAFVLLAGWALALSLACSLWSVARGSDSAILLALTVVGSVTGLVLVGLAVTQNIAPDLLKHGKPRHPSASSEDSASAPEPDPRAVADPDQPPVEV